MENYTVNETDLKSEVCLVMISDEELAFDITVAYETVSGSAGK